MKATMLRTALAVASMTVCLGNAQAEELNFSELESRLAKIESQLAGQDGLQQASYCCDNGCCDASCCCESNCCDSSCCGNSCGCCDCCSSCGCGGGYYGAVEIFWARAHMNEDVIGKLSEEYEIAPRFIVGYENSCGQGARIRYWTYGQQTNTLNPAVGVRFDVDVLDIEGTYRAQFCRTDVTMSAGFRSASFDVTTGGSTVGTDLIGLTAAVEAESLLCCDCCSYWSGLYGGRMSILGGNWEGSAAGIGATRDDNVIVTELYGGIEYGCCHCGYDIYTQLKFEIQNWHSDVVGENTATDSIGFVGPSWTVGVGF